MRKIDKLLQGLLLLPLIIGGAIAFTISQLDDSQYTVRHTVQSSVLDVASSPDEALFTQWSKEYVEQGLIKKTPIPLQFSRAFSKHFTEARGKAELNFVSGQVAVKIDGLESPAEGAHYELWVIDHVSGPTNSAAIDFGENGDRILNLGTLPTGSLETTLAATKLHTFAVDMAAVMLVAPGHTPEFVIGGMQSIRYQIGRQLPLQRPSLIGHFGESQTLSLRLVAGGNSPKQQQLVARGKDLFEHATFGGNGRTCATCHPAFGNFTIDRELIADISTLTGGQDPLFVAEFNPNLPPFYFANPNKPAMESPEIMRSRGLILENIAGFEKDAQGNFVHPPFFRATPALFNMNLTQPFGLGGDIPDLQTFSIGAIMQHFTKTMDRIAGVDFLLPSADDLKAMEAFMLTLKSPASGNFKLSGPGSLLSTSSDPRASNKNRSEIRGRDKFLSVGCTSCHTSTVFSGSNFNTSVELAEQDPAVNLNLISTPTADTGRLGDGTFNTPQLFGLRKAQFFHTGLLGNHFDANGNPLLFANIREAITFYRTNEFRLRHQALSDAFRALSEQDIDDIAAFLVAISVP